MQSFGIRVFDFENETAGVSPAKIGRRRQAGKGLRAMAAVMLTLAAGVPSGYAQQGTVKTPTQSASDLPQEPAPVQTEPLNLRQSARDYSKPAGSWLRNPLKVYMPTTVPGASFQNSPRLENMVKNGKIYLSLSDALALALENNYDIAISRYYMDLADLDILRAKSGQLLQGSGATINTSTQGGYTSTTNAGGGPGGVAGGSAAGAGGLTLTASGAGPAPENMEPTITSMIQLERAEQPQTSAFAVRSFQNTDQYNFTYNQGFVTGTSLAVGFNNSRITSSSEFNIYSPQLDANFKATVTQHLLQGAGIWVNKRFVYQAINNRRITDSTFRQQILYTVNQVENIYWGLVNAYEDVQAKERALAQSTQVAGDNRKQLQIGTMAPLDVLNADQAVASDKQALISSQSTLNYQQQIIKQAIARNLNDPALVAAAVIPTDRVSIEEIPEEKQPVDELVQEAFKQSPVLEQAALTLKNWEISLRGAKNQLLPTLDVYGFYAGTGVGGSQSPDCINLFTGQPCPTNPNDPNHYPTISYGGTLNNMLDNSSPDKGVGFNVTIPLRNRPAQAQQAQALIEYRQAELHLEQLYTQIRISVVNAMYALTNDRALVQASIAAKDYADQNLDAEQKKLHLGASTTALVLNQQRSLASAENALNQANATYAKDRAALYQILATTLQHYGIDLTDAATGNVKAEPVVPGLVAAKPGKEPSTAPPPTTPAPPATTPQ
jgi:outer membrane protein TolC